ncbi:hypothetical protein [Neorhizobium sp. SOG26]|uniref:hypothetical protein n=1 Tax=Neorhizobium sp. SOG26 TaxID=2060726 RepID=UPI001237545D|nr:hypothetical protein [Neorhizobium sp. SOG26]
MRKLSFQKRFNCTEGEYLYNLLEQIRLRGPVTLKVRDIPHEMRTQLSEMVQLGRLTQEPIGKHWLRMSETSQVASAAEIS